MQLIPIPTHLRCSLTNAKQLRNFAKHYLRVSKQNPNAYRGKRSRHNLSRDRLKNDTATCIVRAQLSDENEELPIK